MTAIIQKLRRKRKLSSELDSRWGDVSISYPNAGSWSQYDRASDRVSPASARSSDTGHVHLRKHSSGSSSDRQTAGSSGNIEARKASVDSSLTIPTGYYDARVQSRSKSKPRSPEPQLARRGAVPVALPRSWEDGKFGDSSADEAEADPISALGPSRGRRDETDAYSRASKSPPLSVTSRMRRFSAQSALTDAAFSVPGTASSKRTSFSSSVPSAPFEDPRLARHTPHHEKKPPRRLHTRDPGLGSVPTTQELVPSYDELYG